MQRQGTLERVQEEAGFPLGMLSSGACGTLSRDARG